MDENNQLSLRRRTLRRHAMETGILERLYTIDAVHTTTLVGEGFSEEALEQVNWKLPRNVEDYLHAQLKGLELVCKYAEDGFALTTSLIKELHALITGPQDTYHATDSLGRPLRARLNHGAYKTLPNNVKRVDGSVLEFAPPEQVSGEVEKLVKWYNQIYAVHPVVLAAWLHHRFVQIHPFQDGNGRVARALTHYSLVRDDYMPATVDSHHRDAYLLALDMANVGDLDPLVRLFIELAASSLHHEMERIASEVSWAPEPNAD